MRERIIASPGAYWIGLIMHLFFLIIASLMFKSASESRQVIPMIIFGIPFIIVLVFMAVFLNRQVYIRIIENKTADCRNFLKQEIVPLSDISDVKPVWFNTYRFKIKGRTYLFFGLKDEAKTLKLLAEAQKHN